MKTVKNSLMALCLMSLPFGAFAQEERKAADLWYAEQAENVKNMLTSDEDKAQAADYIKRLYEMPTDMFMQYTKRGDLNVVLANIGVIDDQGNLDFYEVNNGTLKIRFALLAKVFGDEYGNKICPLYAFEGTKDASDYNSPIVYNYDLGGTSDYDVATYDPTTNVIDYIPGTQGSNNQQTAGATPTPGKGIAGFVDTGKGYEVLVDADGKRIKDGQGNDIVQVTNQNSAKTSSGNANPGGVSNSARTATVINSVTVDGPQDLVAKLENGSQGGGSASNQTLAPEPKFVKRTVNGVETEYIMYPPAKPGETWTVQHADQNTDLAILDRNGKEYIMSGQKAEIGPRGANKDGMRDASGTAGNKGIGKHGGVWTGRSNGLGQYRGNGGNFWPAGGGAVVIGCGGRPQPGPTFYCVNNDWIDGGGNANMYSWNNCQGQGCGGGGGPVRYGSSTW